ECQRQKETLKKEYDSRIQELQAELAEKTEPLDKEIQSISFGIKSFLDEHKEVYLSEDRKTLKLETGEIGYRRGKASVKTRSTEKFINEVLERNDLLKAKESFVKKMQKVYIRTSLELDKEAILKNPLDAASVTGVEIAEGVDRFFAKPYSTETEIEL
ncbi:MAG: host-nuclease inhibitor Gam family protein, partial [Leptospiraceae bacterium]|nr:host-nuclease inhibitor Gam family protein [Leptospiraceae bacterium]